MRLCSVVMAVAAAAGLASAQHSPEQAPLNQQPFGMVPPSLIEDPPIAFGTWNMHGTNATKAVELAIKTGFRHIDAAKIYGNQEAVGKGIASGLRAARLDRDQLWVTSKLWNDAHAPASVTAALEQTLTELGLDYLDLYLIHWPVSSVGNKPEIEFIETWKALTKLPSSKVRNIGVCNFSPLQLQQLLDATPGHKPFVHQFELHPHLPQDQFVQWHFEHGIRVAAYSPLGNTNPTYHSGTPPLLENDVVKKVAAANSITPAQAVLAWAEQRGTIAVVKSTHAARIAENLASLDVELSRADLHTLETRLPLVRFNNPGAGWGVRLFDGLEGTAETLAETWAKFCGGLAALMGWERRGGAA